MNTEKGPSHNESDSNIQSAEKLTFPKQNDSEFARILAIEIERLGLPEGSSWEDVSAAIDDKALNEGLINQEKDTFPKQNGSEFARILAIEIERLGLPEGSSWEDVSAAIDDRRSRIDLIQGLTNKEQPLRPYNNDLSKIY